MFSVGLEFTGRRVVSVLPRAGPAVAIELSLMAYFGYAAAWALGWKPSERFLAAGVVAISSTMFVTRSLAESGAAERIRSFVLGALVLEDLAAILLLAIAAAAAAGVADPTQALAPAAGKVAASLLALAVAGYAILPPLLRRIAGLGNRETLLVAAVGLCFVLALATESAGSGTALGAFLAGSLVAQAGAAEVVERQVRPLRDVFAAVFFVSVGMAVDPSAVLRHLPAVFVLSLVVLAGKAISVSAGAFLSGHDLKTAVQAGMAMGQIGEFSLLLAGTAAATRLLGGDMVSIAVAVAAATALGAPLLLRAAEPAAMALDRHLPRPIQTFLSLYGTWIESLRRGAAATEARIPYRRRIATLALDATLLAITAIGTALAIRHAAPDLARRFDLSPLVVRLGLGTAGAVLAFPLLRGMLTAAQALGAALAAAAVPVAAAGRADVGLAPRRAFTLALQLGLTLAVGLPIVAVTQPFLPIPIGPAILLLVLAALAVAFWRRTADLHAHVRAGAMVLAEALAKPSKTGSAFLEDPATFPGFGQVEELRIQPGSAADGRSLAELNLRGLTGAAVLAIRRGADSVLVPDGHERLRAGDVIALAGPTASLVSARALLDGP